MPDIFRHASLSAIEACMKDLAEHKQAKKAMREGASAWLRTLKSLREREAWGALPTAQPPAAPTCEPTEQYEDGSSAGGSAP